MTDCSDISQRLQEEDPEVLREAAQDAGDYDCVETIPDLIALLQNKNLGVQEAAEISLRQLGGADAVKLLAPLLRTENVQVRNLAMDILRQIGDQYISTFFELLRDEDADIRIFASDILGSTGNILAVPPFMPSPVARPRGQCPLSGRGQPWGTVLCRSGQLSQPGPER